MSGQRLRILLVEDDEDDYVLVRSLLDEVQARSYQLDWKSTYEDALQGTEHDQYDACLLDYRLGERDGIQFLHEMSSRDSKLPIILLTGEGNYEVDMQAMQSGASDYLVKDQITGPLLERSIRYAIERRRSEDRLRQSEERYRRIVEKRYHRLVQNVPILLFRLLNDFSLHFINQACLPILGYTPEEAMETPGWFLERVGPEDRARIEKLLECAFDANGRSFTTECRFSNRKGHAVHALLKCICCTECMTEGEPECVEGILVDITDRVLLEKTVVQREKLKTLGTIAAEVAHEIRNPLVSVGGFARRLQKRFPDAPEADIILKESERLETILGRISDYLTPVEICPRECVINRLITRCVDLLSPHILAKRVTCRVELNENLPTVLVDPDILTQVCINLINNALTATAEGGELLITTFETDRNLHVNFRNPAPEAKLKEPELLFLPFDEGGKSIGLPLCYRLLRKMGGLLSFAQEPGHVLFTVSVPKTKNNHGRTMNEEGNDTHDTMGP